MKRHRKSPSPRKEDGATADGLVHNGRKRLPNLPGEVGGLLDELRPRLSKLDRDGPCCQFWRVFGWGGGEGREAGGGG